MKIKLSKETDIAENKVWYIVSIGSTNKFFLNEPDARELFNRVKEHGAEKIEEEIESFEIPD